VGYKNIALHVLDFTFNKYRNICQRALKSGYEVMTIYAYIGNKVTDKNFLVMRHNVDTWLGRAPRMAFLDKSPGIKGTYYFCNQ